MCTARQAPFQRALDVPLYSVPLCFAHQQRNEINVAAAASLPKLLVTG